MGELSIRIRLGDREYPLRVEASEEERVRKAAKYVNDRIRDFREKYRLPDPQDVVHMVAFDTAVEMLKASESQYVASEEATNRLNALLSRMDQLVQSAPHS